MNDEASAIELEPIETTSSTKRVVLLGILTLITITAAAVLHVNQPEFILDRFVGITELEYSLFDTTLYLSYLIFGIATGLLSDRWGKRRVFVLVGSTGSMIFYWLMTTTLSYPTLLLFRFLQGSFTVMVWQTFMTLAIDFSDSHNRGRNMGIFGAFLALGMGLGPAIGGFIATVGVFVPYFAAVGLNALVFVIALVSLRDPPMTKTRPTLGQSFMLARKKPELVVPGIFNLLDRLHIGFILTALPFFLSVSLGLDESLRGMSLAIFALPFIILQYPMGKLSDKHGRFRQLVIGSIGYGVVLSVVGIVGVLGFSLLLVMLAILGVFAGITSPPSMALVGDIVGQEDSAMGMGFFNFLGNIGITLGPIIFGVLIPIMGMSYAFVVVGILELITLVANIILVKTVFKDKIT
ncbi:MAG: MFS transporter [Candidatus Thorarchaeota archaeon]|nr:MFS transporter [Candidatus Thorarchaeota archaeon]